MHQHFADLVARDAVVERRAQMQPELVGPVQRDHQPDGQQASGMPRQSGSRPDLAPCIARDQRLELLVEIVALRERAIDVRVAEHRPAHRQSVVVAFAFVHGVSCGECGEEPYSRRAGEKLHECLRERRRRLDVRQVRRGQFDIARTRDVLGDEPRVGRRRRQVTRPGDHERRCANALQRTAQVGVADGRARRDVPFGGRRLERCAQLRRSSASAAREVAARRSARAPPVRWTR